MIFINRFIMKILKILQLILISFPLLSCGFYKPVDQRTMPDTAKAKARKNVEEGRGVSMGGILNRKTTYEFSTSNPLWRASLEILDFMPLSTVDYSGGMIVTDWYSENNNEKESIKISVRFLSNEVRSDSVKIIIHKKNCSTVQNCKTVLLNKSKISEELTSTIIRKAALLQVEDKKKKKR